MLIPCVWDECLYMSECTPGKFRSWGLFCLTLISRQWYWVFAVQNNSGLFGLCGYGKTIRSFHVSALNIDTLICFAVLYPGNFAVSHTQLLTGLLLSCVSILAPVGFAEFYRKHHSCFWCLQKSCQCFETFLQNLHVTSKIISAVFVLWNKLLVQFYNSSSYLGLNSYSLCCFKELNITGKGALH